VSEAETSLITSSHVVQRSEPVAGVRLLTLNRPKRLNAMSWELLHALHAELDAVAEDADCRVLILTGAGPGFCAGADLFELDFDNGNGDRDSPRARMRLQKYIAELILRLRGLEQPVIAAVNGAATGGGFALALGSDVRVISERARFSAAFVKVGLSGCDIGVSWLLPRLIGASRTFELLLSGRVIDAEEAERLGLCTFRVRHGDVVPRAVEVALSILANSPMGVALTKETMWSQLEVASLRAGIDLENRTQVMATYSADHAEAVAAFVEHRAQSFSNR
jgi:enoyl-CoA hydratase